MTEHLTTPLYEKVGRRYVPVIARWNNTDDQMPVGTFRLTYAAPDGSKRLEFAVEPATARTAAAMMVAKAAIVEAITEASKMRPSGATMYTKKQLAIIEQFKKDMGGMFPTHWTAQTPYDIADAAIKAVKEFKA